VISFTSSGDLKRTFKFLNAMSRGEMFRAVSKQGQQGVQALSSATPVDSGETAALWDYSVKISQSSAVITWTNGHVVDGVPIAIILQYGHGTGTGGYVAGRNYINPAIRPVFDKIADEVWKVVTSA